MVIWRNLISCININKHSPKKVAEIPQNYNLSGNICELENIVERLVIMEKGDEASIDSLPKQLISVFTQEMPIFQNE